MDTNNYILVKRILSKRHRKVDLQTWPVPNIVPNISTPTPNWIQSPRSRTVSWELAGYLPVLERRRMPKSQLEVMSIDWERSQVWPSPRLPSPNEPPDDPPPKDAADEWHFSRSTSWSIRTISHIPVSSLVTWDCRMWARIMLGLSRKAILRSTLLPLWHAPVLLRMCRPSAEGRDWRFLSDATSSFLSFWCYFLLSMVGHGCLPAE